MKHPKTHIHQTNEDQTQRTNIKSRKGKTTNNIRITADLSTETLQARREWQGILKVMKEKNLQPRLLYPARISFRYEGEIKKLYRQAKAKRSQHHQTSSPTITKGYSLDRKHKKGV